MHSTATCTSLVVGVHSVHLSLIYFQLHTTAARQQTLIEHTCYPSQVTAVEKELTVHIGTGTCKVLHTNGLAGC